MLGPVVRARLSPEERSALPEVAEAASVFCVAPLALSPALAAEAYGALWRDLVARFAAGGTYLCAAAPGEGTLLVQALGFEALEGARATHRGRPVRGYVLDLPAGGAEPWLEAVVAGRATGRA